MSDELMIAILIARAIAEAEKTAQGKTKAEREKDAESALDKIFADEEARHKKKAAEEIKKVITPFKPFKKEAKMEEAKRIRGTIPEPVVYDRKRKINNKTYTNQDWVAKAHEELAEIIEQLTLENVDGCDEEKERIKTNKEIMDLLTVCVSWLHARGVVSGLGDWEGLVQSTNFKNSLRGALEEH